MNQSQPSSSSTDTEYRSVDQNKSYASATQQSQFPRKNQAIIFSLIPGSNALDYVQALSRKIGTENILHCGIISEKRVRMYLKSQEIVQKFLETDGFVTIFRQNVRARPYMSNNKKIIISNVPPHVPHDVVFNVIKSHGVTTTSDIRFLHLSMIDDYRSILSELRSVFVSADTASKLPPSVTINYEDDQYRIFFNDAQLKCFICHQFGHVTGQCPLARENTNGNDISKYNPQSEEIHDISDDYRNQILDLTTNPNDEIQQDNTTIPLKQTVNTTPLITDPISHSLTKEIVEIVDNFSPTQENISNKRPLSESTPSTSCSVSDIIQSPEAAVNSEKIVENSDSSTTKKPPKKKKKPKAKRQKCDIEPVSINELLKPVEESFKIHNDAGDYPLSFTNFKLLMDMVKGQPDPVDTAKQFTDDMKGLVTILQDSYPLVSRSMKTRFTKLKKKILLYLNEPDDEKMDCPSEEPAGESSESDDLSID